MTFGEIERAIESYSKMREQEERLRATYDYIQADLIGRSIARIYNSANKMPSLSDAYPALFNKEEEQAQIQAKRDELSALRFQLFAQSFNKRFEEVGKSE